MINPTEYSSLLGQVRLAICKYADNFCNKRDYGIASHKDKIKLVIVNTYYYYLNKANINPITNDAQIKKCRGQIPIPPPGDDGSQLYGFKEYDEEVILKCIKRINQILKTNFVLRTYADVYYNYQN